MESVNRKATIHCITNIVTVNDCANVLHAIGAAPVMAHHPVEVEQVSKSADALVLNLGTTESFEAMKVAIKAAADEGKPIVIDPVGTGGIDYRRKMFWELIEIASPTCVRGNASEIKALYYDKTTTVGVDASKNSVSDTLTDEELVAALAKKLGCIVVASGKTDIITDGNECKYVTAGTEMLTNITGAGCMSSAIIGGYLGRISNGNEKNVSYIEAVTAACQCMGECGEKAANKTKNENAGIMTFHTYLLDEISLYK